MCLFNSLSRYFVLAGLSPNPSPEVGGALIQDNFIYLGLKLKIKKKVTATS
jgi:hypothetical protein